MNADHVCPCFTVYGLCLDGLSYGVIVTGFAYDFPALIMHARIKCLEIWLRCLPSPLICICHFQSLLTKESHLKLLFNRNHSCYFCTFIKLYSHASNPYMNKYMEKAYINSWMVSKIRLPNTSTISHQMWNVCMNLIISHFFSNSLLS
jgi:hypothetical protein